MGWRRTAASLRRSARGYLNRSTSSQWRRISPSVRLPDGGGWSGSRSGMAGQFQFPSAKRFAARRVGTGTSAAAWTSSFHSELAARYHSSVVAPFWRSRACCHEQRREHTSGQDFEGKERISVTFVDKDGEETTVQVPVGMSMLEAAHENDIELEGACEGSLACSTCHVIVMEEDVYTKLPEPSDEENDMLDLAFGLTETSRLGCQVIAKPELDGMHLALPAATRNFAVDGHVPKPH